MNWIQYQISHGVEWNANPILLFVCLCHCIGVWNLRKGFISIFCICSLLPFWLMSDHYSATPRCYCRTWESSVTPLGSTRPFRIHSTGGGGGRLVSAGGGVLGSPRRGPPVEGGGGAAVWHAGGGRGRRHTTRRRRRGKGGADREARGQDEDECTIP